MVLAAGGSSRLESPKQLLFHAGKTLVRRAAEAAMEAGCAPVAVVLGSQAEQVAEALVGLPVRAVHHPAWAEGMGGSLRAGLKALSGEVDALLVVLCDQLRVDVAHLRALLEAFASTGAPIIASGYEGTRGVPALFSRAMFAELEALGADQGARGVIARQPARVVEVPLPGGGEDVDTRGDLSRLG